VAADKLAIEGGAPVSAQPFPQWPQFDPQVCDAVVEILRSGKVNYWTGPVGMRFEQAFADWCGAKYGVSTSSGTSALHVALAGLGIGPGDEVIVPSYTFIASSFSICQAGAVPVFADVEKESHTLDVADAEAKWRGRKAGTIGEIGAFSFCQSKHFTTGGEGGAVITDDENVAWTCRSFRDHGYDVRERLRLLELEAKLPYVHNSVGYNYRMTEMQSAIGLIELARMDSYHLPYRRRNAGHLMQRLKDLKQILYLPLDTEERQNAFWMFPIVLDMDRLKVDSARQVVAALEAEGVPAGPVMWPQCYQERAYQEHNGFGRLKYPFRSPDTRPEAVQYDKVYCPNAAWLEERTFFVPCHPVYGIEQMEKLAQAIEKVLTAYAK
jgi:dTDP-4-amino-4,6-dideoxygalactose transaminase